MRRRRSTRSVIKLLAAAAVATASIVGLVRLSTPRRLPTLADRLKVRFARFAPMADAGADQPTLPKGLGTVEMRLAMGVIKGSGGRCPSNPYAPITIKLAAPIGQRRIVDGLFLPPRPLWPKSLRIPRPYRRNLVISALAFVLAVLAMVRAAMAVRRWRRANAEVRRWRCARDHTS